jgi:hypothetical protein
MRRQVVTLLAAVAAASFPVSARAQTAAEQEVLAVVDRVMASMLSRDTAALRSLFDPQARLVTALVRQGQPVMLTETIDGWIRSLSSAPDSLRLIERTFDREVRIDGGLATVWTRYTFHVNDRFSHCGVDAFQLVRSGGRWIIVALADTRQREGCQMGPSR